MIKKDGLLTIDEITSYAEQQKIEISESDILSLDLDNDGVVTASEFDNELSSSDINLTSD